MKVGSEVLQVYSTGPVTVVGFGGRVILDDINLAECRDTILTLARDQKWHTMAFDLTGIRLVPSGLLGILASLHRHGIKVEVYNPSPGLREVLEVTHFDKLVEIREVETPGS